MKRICNTLGCCEEPTIKIEDIHVLMHLIRYSIIQLLQKQPNLYITKISKALDIDRRHVTYHLAILEQYGFVASKYEIGQAGYAKGKAQRQYWCTPKVNETLTYIKELT